MGEEVREKNNGEKKRVRARVRQRTESTGKEERERTVRLMTIP